MTHDLICTIIDEMGYEVTKIEIHNVEKETYFASIFLDNGDDEIVIDARPSDAIAVAIRTKADIFVTPNVIAEGTISTDKEKDEKEDQEFKNFIKDIKASDFQKLLDENKDSNQ